MELQNVNLLSTALGQRVVGSLDPGGARNFFRGSWTYECKRRIWWEKRGEAYTNPARGATVEKMTKGTILGEYFQKELISKTDYLLLFAEHELDAILAPGVRVVGHIDGVLFDRAALKPVALFEAKSTSSFGYKACCSNFGDRGHYSWSYIKQATRYLMAWNLKFPTAAMDQICIFLYNVNGDEDSTTKFCSRDWWLTPSPGDFAADMADLQEIVNAKRLPRRAYTEKDWKCKTCPYLTKCWTD